MTNTPTPISVYTITMMDDRDITRPPVWRAVAVVTDKDLALRMVRNNELDISEGGTNRYAVIEKTYLNELYPLSEERIWFEWNPADGEYLETECPHQFQRVVCFGIG